MENKKPLTTLAQKLRRKKPEPLQPPAPALTVEPFDGQDFHTLSVLLNGSKAALGQPLPTPAQWASLRTALEDGRILCYIARLHGSPVGVCMVGLRYSSRQFATIGLLSDLYVRPEARGNGAAHALVNAAVQTVHTAGGTGLRVSCSEEHAAICRALGFDEPLGTSLGRTF